MADYNSTKKLIQQYLSARVPLVIVKSVEKGRTVKLLGEVASAMNVMPFFGWSRIDGLFQMGPRSTVNGSATLLDAIDKARSQFRSVKNVNFIFEDIEEIDRDSATSRDFAATVVSAEHHGSGCVILVTDRPVWTGLSMLGMTAELDLPTTDEVLAEVMSILQQHQGVIQVNWDYGHVHQAAEILTGITMAQVSNVIHTMLTKGRVEPEDVHELAAYKDGIVGAQVGIERVKVTDKDQVGGLGSLRRWLESRRELISSDLSDLPFGPPRGVLLCGVPGCGKSLSAKAIAYSWKLPLYRLDMGAVQSKWVGESESQFRDALEAAEKVSPCILWIDEIEKALAGANDSTGITRRLIGQFLYWLQEAKAKVFLVATANDVRSLPPELLRKGRFDEVFFVDLPTADERSDILQMYFARYLGYDIPPLLLEELVGLSDGFSGADIDATVRDIAVFQYTSHAAGLPSEEKIRAFFANVVPYSQTNPDDVNEIRAWGMNRAVPAGESFASAKTGVQDGVRQVLVPSV